jgi:hypothetical protein
MSAPVVMLSASYGAGGSLVGPRVAQQLDVPFVNRAIPVGVSRELAVRLEEALAHDARTASADCSPRLPTDRRPKTRL